MKYLNEILALGLCDEGLQLGRGEGVNQASFGDDEQQNLGAGEDRKLVSLVRDGVSMDADEMRVAAQRDKQRATPGGTCLLHDAGLALGEGDVATRLVLDELDFDLPSLATGLVLIVVVVVHVFVGPGALDAAAGIASGVAIASDLIVLAGRGVLVVLGDLGGHDVWERGRKRYCV
jgi:hypothetical protein